MTPKSFAVVACRLLAIWFFVQATHEIAASVGNVILFSKLNASSFYAAPPIWQDLFRAVAPCLTGFCAAVILWLGSSVFAESVTRSVAVESDGSSGISLRGWQFLGFSLLGLFFCVQGLSGIGGLITLKCFPTSFNFIFGASTFSELPKQVAIAAAQFFIGLALLFYAQKTIRVLDYVQCGGRDETLKNETGA